jgi:hypothetical protein
MQKAIPLKRVTAVAVALATAGLLSAGATASTAAADEQAAAQFTCGFHWGGDLYGYYGHCDAPPRTDIVIHVEGGNERDMCVKPGLTRLGKWPDVTYAAYTGRLCWAG